MDRIIAAARDCFRSNGPDVSLHVIARSAGVGPATLFRNFADKEELVLACLAQQLRLRVNPVAVEALQDQDAAKGFLAVAEALLQVASDELNLLSAVAGRRRLLAGITMPLLESLGTLLLRAQEQGTIRPDVVPDDVIPLLSMAIGALETNVLGSDAWRRYASLLADGFLMPANTRPLPPLVPIPGIDVLLAKP
ncbi:MAG TPA: helix-turn-helix domain-containing protein [Micrococcaceae bacterium]|jgi:AcrR family transcriptional regulator|nr:helix-turn-helix domain-containing protein [Micrococcaceae bacterium]